MAETIPTVDPEVEPEYVGAHSGLSDGQDVCKYWDGETREDIDQCGNPATHTIVMYDGSLHEIAMCDSCGEPDDIDDLPREWTVSDGVGR